MPLNDSQKRCTAPTRDGDRCKNPAVDGYDVCRMHGGGGGRPPKHGLYSTKREQLREKMEEAGQLEGPGELWREIKVLRALLSDFLEELDEVDAETIGGATKLVSEIRKTINAISKVKTRTALTAGELQFVQARLADIFRRHVPREEQDTALSELKQITQSDERQQAGR